MIALALTLLLCTQPAADAWREHPEFIRGARAFEAQRWDEAARAFEAAYAEHPRPELLWAQAQSLRFGGHCDAALPLYERFVASGPTAEEIADANTNIATCRELVGDVPEPIAAAPQPVVQASPPPPAPAVSPVERADVDDARPLPKRRTRREPDVRRDAWGHGLLWSGVGVAGIGAGLLAAGHVQREQAAGAHTELEYRQRFSGAPALGQAGIAVLATGAALVTAGIVRFAVISTRARRGGSAMAMLRTRGR
ncbi:MAG TPA: tetratricopeptide repeat protein [Nannocystaceae bacterium]|nr:tetratricopeptide repeat protein [Nannocystaceae bacterium]